jgi:cation transport ATPase
LNSQTADLLARADEQRLREFKYRFSQSVVFGIPVIALQYFGRRLGPVDADRWVSLLQALLAGWIVYVNLGMLFEGLLLFRQRVTGDLLVAAAAVVIYMVSLVSAARGILTARVWYPLAFHVCVLILAIWTGVRWWQLSRRVRG